MPPTRLLLLLLLLLIRGPLPRPSAPPCGLDARLCHPAPASSGLTCGRRSTGCGGKCAAAPGRTCFFCSRLPYVVVRAGAARAAAGGGGAIAAAAAAAAAAMDALLLPPCGRASGGSQAEVEAGEAVEVIIVEPGLREIFRVAPATEEYAAVVACLPEVWVGPPSVLTDLANKLCDAMVLNFSQPASQPTI